MGKKGGRGKDRGRTGVDMYKMCIMEKKKTPTVECGAPDLKKDLTIAIDDKNQIKNKQNLTYRFATSLSLLRLGDILRQGLYLSLGC